MIVSSATILKIIESVLNCLSKLYLQLESLRKSQRKKLLRKQWKIKKNRSDNNKIDPRYRRKENVIIRINIQYLLVIRNLFPGEQKTITGEQMATCITHPNNLHRIKIISSTIINQKRSRKGRTRCASSARTP